MDLNRLRLIFKQASSIIQNLSDKDAFKVKDVYIDFDSLIGQTLPLGYKFTYNTSLYKTRQDNLLIQEQYKPGVGTEALYEEINEVNEGTIDDPIPYNNNMALVENIYYIQNDIIYKCIRSTGVAVFNDLKDLIGIYVIQAE